MIFRSRWQSGILVPLVIVGLTLGILLTSPLILLIPAAMLDVDWQQLTNIGQSYTGFAAVLSAAALVGIVASIRLQADQTRLLRRQLTREMQFNLLNVAISDPHYSSVLRVNDASTNRNHDDFRKTVFRNLWVRHLEFAYLNREMSESELRLILEGFFGNADNRTWFDNGRQHHSAYYGGIGTAAMERRLVQILNESYAYAERVSEDGEPQAGE